MLALRINDGGEHCLPLEDIIMQEETKRKKARLSMKYQTPAKEMRKRASASNNHSIKCELSTVKLMSQYYTSNANRIIVATT